VTALEHNHEGPAGRAGCPVCNQELMEAGFNGQPAPDGTGMVTCPNCRHVFRPVPQPAEGVRMTESVGAPEETPAAEGEEGEPAEETAEATAKATATKPHGDVDYADPGYLDGAGQQASDTGLTPVARYDLSTADRTRAAWSYINQKKNAAQYTASQLKLIKGRIKGAASKFNITISDSSTEAMIDGARSFDDVRELVRAALAEDERERSGEFYAYCYIADLTDSQVVYSCGSKDELWQRPYSVDEAGQVTLGVPSMVVRTYTPAPAAMQTGAGEAVELGEAPAPAEQQRDRIDGRVLEAKGVDEGGGRVFGVRIIAYGDSKNMRRYPEAVMRAAAPLYEGAKAYDHHRSDQEMASGTIQGLIGSYRDVVATDVGLEGDLHLFPGAVHAAEALDAALGQEQGLPPLVGISHDVYGTYKSIVVGGRRLQEATAITKVNSSDIVADPAAGGRAVRMVAGGETPATTGSGAEPDSSKEESVPPTLDELLGVLKEASDEQLAGVGLKRHTASNGNGNGGTPATEATPPPPPSVLHALRGGETRASEAIGKDSWLARTLTRDKILAAGLPMTSFDRIMESLPEPMTEADVDARIANIKDGIAVFEGASLTPRIGGATVGSESIEKKIEALDKFFEGDYQHGYRSFRQAFVDITGRQPKNWDEDFNRTMMAESVGPFDSGVHAQESMTSSSWNLVLGDSITRRMVAEYGQPSLQSWRNIVSSIAPVNDFRTVRIDRIGGYGTLPAVAQAAAYTALTSPTNEEVTYTPTKRGGTEDLTLEMIANDDVRAISKIPVKLGLAAAQTLYRFVWDFLRANAAIYDAIALFNVATHANDLIITPPALSQTALSLIRAKMRAQSAYGDTADILSLVPRTLVVPASLEEIAYQLTKSVVAVPATPAGPSDTPNIHSSMDFIVVDYFPGVTGTPASNWWFVVADPSLCPTIEIGFYQGRDTPELFTQSDPTQGSVFSNDVIKYKIRHIYSGAVLDYRGFQRQGIP
jgi:hypothetical protein